MTGDDRLRGWALLCLCTLGCYTGFEEPEASCKTPISTGDVRITEILANPRGPDGEQEYIELFNAGSTELDMSGSLLVSSRDDGSSERAHRIDGLSLSPGDYVVLGNGSTDSLGLLDYSYGSSLGNLRNGNARVALRCGATLVDEARYTTTLEGHALELDAGVSLAQQDDRVPDHWCASEAESIEGLEGNHGTPGAPNDPCPVTLREGTCLEDDRARDIVSPAAGELRISEWMANPANVPDSEGEWLELTAMTDVDLNGVSLGDSSSDELLFDQDRCFVVEAGTSVLVVRNPEASENGGLDDAQLTFTFSLNNEDETIRLWLGEEQIDLVSYQTSTAGASTQIDPQGNLCTAWLPYGRGDLGSPGELNPACP